VSAVNIISSRSTHAAYDTSDLLAQFAASQRRQLANLREIASILDPAPAPALADPYACEICGGSTSAETRSGFALRNGAVIHAACLAAQMEER
jgi:hypothetical protein